MDTKQKIEELEQKYQDLWSQSCKLRDEADAVQKEKGQAIIAMLFNEFKMTDVVWEWAGDNQLEARMSNGGFQELDTQVKPWYHDRFHLGDMTISFDDGVVRIHAHPISGPRREGADEILKIVKKYKLQVKTDYMDSRMAKCREEYRKWKKLKRKLAGEKRPKPAMPPLLSYNVFLTDFPIHKKIGVIKMIREYTNASLAEAVSMVENMPCKLKEKVGLDTANKIAGRFREWVNARVMIEPISTECTTNTNANG